MLSQGALLLRRGVGAVATRYHHPSPLLSSSSSSFLNLSLARPHQQQAAVAASFSSSSSDESGSSAESAAREARMRTLLTEQLEPTHLVIQDVSGGCGAMYNMEVESHHFKGKTLVAQHRLVNKVLAKEISEMHGLSLKTRAPK